MNRKLRRGQRVAVHFADGEPDENWTGCGVFMFADMVAMLKVQEVLMQMPSHGMSGTPCHRKIRQLIERATKAQSQANARTRCP